jgi:hypothetical protein
VCNYTKPRLQGRDNSGRVADVLAAPSHARGAVVERERRPARGASRSLSRSGRHGNRVKENSLDPRPEPAKRASRRTATARFQRFLLWPSFETPPAAAPQDEGRGFCPSPDRPERTPRALRSEPVSPEPASCAKRSGLRKFDPYNVRGGTGYAL